MDWKESFEMNRTQRNGTLVLLVLLLLVAIVPPIVSRFDIHPTEDDTAYRAEAENFFANLKDEGRNREEYSKATDRAGRHESIELFLFNPNTLSVEDFRRLGLSEKQAKTIQNYREKGGRFRIKSDVKKIYGIREEQFNTLYPYIDLPESYDSQKNTNATVSLEANKPARTGKVMHQIDVNLADTSAYAGLPGIGAVLSARIVKFREKLGGFVHIEQLSEVFGLKAEVYQQMVGYLKCDPSVVRKLSLNYSTMSDLAKHPYIGYQKAKLVVEFRSKNGAFSSLDQLVKSNLLTTEEFKKASPYIVLNK